MSKVVFLGTPTPCRSDCATIEPGVICRNEPSEQPQPIWDEQAVERMKNLKEAQKAGKFAEAFEEMFPPDEQDSGS